MPRTARSSRSGPSPTRERAQRVAGRVQRDAVRERRADVLDAEHVDEELATARAPAGRRGTPIRSYARARSRRTTRSGETTASAPANTRAKRSSERGAPRPRSPSCRASARSRSARAGNSTSQPSRSSTATVARPASGNSVSLKQVTKSETRTGRRSLAPRRGSAGARSSQLAPSASRRGRSPRGRAVSARSRRRLDADRRRGRSGRRRERAGEPLSCRTSSCPAGAAPARSPPACSASDRARRRGAPPLASSATASCRSALEGHPRRRLGARPAAVDDRGGGRRDERRRCSDPSHDAPEQLPAPDPGTHRRGAGLLDCTAPCWQRAPARRRDGAVGSSPSGRSSRQEDAERGA